MVYVIRDVDAIYYDCCSYGCIVAVVGLDIIMVVIDICRVRLSSRGVARFFFGMN